MNKVLFFGGLAVCTICLCGCVIVAGNDGLCAATAGCNRNVISTIAEIDAISKVCSEPAQVEAYKAIADRKRLCPLERQHLIKAIEKSKLPQPSKEELMMMIVKKPQEPQEQAGGGCPLKK